MPISKNISNDQPIYFKRSSAGLRLKNPNAIETARATISADGQTQTIVITEPGDKTPFVLVYDRE